MKKITKILLIAMFCAISGLSKIANAQNIQAYSDATNDGRGFSYYVQLSITPLENNEITHAGGWVIKLISVNPDSKGYYNKGKTNRFFSCSELGSICNPSKFDMVLVKVNYQCENNAEKLITFYGIDREQTIIVKQKPNTKCSIELESIKVRNNADEPIYRKRINEIEYPQQNTSTSNSNIPSSSLSNPAAQSGGSSEVYVNGQSTAKSASSVTTTQTAKSNVSEKNANPAQIPDDYKGNPMTYNSNGGSKKNNSTEKSSFQQGMETGQQISKAITPLGNALGDALKRKNAEEHAKDLDVIEINKKREEDYQILRNDVNDALSDSKYFEQNVIQKIPSLLNTNSTSWEMLLNSKEFASAIGMNYLYTTTKIKPYRGSNSGIRKDILDTANRDVIYSLKTFGGFTGREVEYHCPHILNGVQYRGNALDHVCKFIYNQNNIVIGFYIEFFTTYYKGGYPSYPIEEYYRDIFSKIGENYLLLDANTILMKDKLLVIDKRGIELYDLNLLRNQYLVNWNNYKSSPNFKKLGIGFKQLSTKIIKGYYALPGWKYAIYSTNDKGVIIGSLEKDGIAEKAGLKIDDIISNINGIPVTSIYILQLIVQAPTKDNKLNIIYLRNGIEYKTTVDI